MRWAMSTDWTVYVDKLPMPFITASIPNLSPCGIFREIATALGNRGDLVQCERKCGSLVSCGSLVVAVICERNCGSLVVVEICERNCGLLVVAVIWQLHSDRSASREAVCSNTGRPPGRYLPP